MKEPGPLSYHLLNLLSFLLYEQEINPYHVKPLNLGGYMLQTHALVYLTNTSSLS